MKCSIISKLIAASMFTALATGSYAIVLEGFETDDLANWQATSPTPQTLNAVNSVSTRTPVFGSSHVTEGTKSGTFETTWTLTSPATASNPYISGGATTYWSIRYNINAAASLPSISNTTGLLQADIFNPNAYPVQVSLYLVDVNGTGGNERGPFQTIAANSAAAYTWDLATQAPVSFVNGNGALDGTQSKLKGMFVYTESAPTAELFTLDVDNIRDANAQSDVTAPAPPVLYSAKQGATPGQVVLSWKANTETDLAGYKVYMSDDASFGAPTLNRLAFPVTPLATAAASATGITLNGIATTGNVYFKVTAYDNATPLSNESVAAAALGVALRADGAAPADTVVLDLDRNIPGTSSYNDEGYFHAIVYNGQALTGLSRNYDSATAAGVDAGAVTLTPKSDGIVVWANLLDGSSTASVALSDASVAALTTFVGADGNLLISGAGLAEDLSQRNAVTQAFLANVLKSSVVSFNAATGAITGGGILIGMGQATTNLSVYVATVGFMTTSNEVLSALPGALPACIYDGVATGYAAVANAHKTVQLGFGLESVGRSTGTADSVAARQSLMQAVVAYLLGADVNAANDWQLFE